MNQTLVYCGGFFQLRYAGCYPNDNYAAEVACVIVAQSWLNRLRFMSYNSNFSRETLDWVFNNSDVMDAFERSMSVGDQNFKLLEGLQYRCENCCKTTTLREAHLVAVDGDGLPDHEGFPKYLCKKCTIKAIGEDET